MLLESHITLKTTNSASGFDIKFIIQCYPIWDRKGDIFLDVFNKLYGKTVLQFHYTGIIISVLKKGNIDSYRHLHVFLKHTREC